MEIKIGVDVGNFDTKTQLTSTESSYASYENEQLVAPEFLYFEGRYYVPTSERNNQEQDKTKDDYSTIMTLFGIAKEILAQATSNCMTAEGIQSRVKEVTNVRLGVGLPVGYFSKLAKKTLAYYQERFSDVVEFSYKGPKSKNTLVHFKIKFDNIGIYPQDVIAVIKNPDLSIPREYSDYDIIGIGGGTLDIIPVRNRRPEVQHVISKEHGTTQLFAEISKKLQQNGFNAKDQNTLEKVVRGIKTTLDNPGREKEKQFILDCVKSFSDKMIDDLIHEGLNFEDYPTVFIGGGALLLKDYLAANPSFSQTEFVKSVNENAIYYAKAV